MVGGWPQEVTPSSYSLVGDSCSPSLPPLPRPHMWDPLVELVQSTLLTCYIDYDTVAEPRFRSKEGMLCWGLRLPAKEAWKPIISPKKTRFLAASASLGDRLLLLGGSKSMGPGLARVRSSRLVQQYSLTSRRWSKARPLPHPVHSACAATLPHGVLLVGDFSSGPANAYLLGSTGQWSALPRSLHQHTAPACGRATLGGQQVVVVVSGGAVEYYSGQARAWRVLPAPEVVRIGPRPSVGWSRGRLVVVGGLDREMGEVSVEVEAWLEEEGRWQVEGEVEVARSRQGQVELPTSLVCPAQQL